MRLAVCPTCHGRGYILADAADGGEAIDCEDCTDGPAEYDVETPERDHLAQDEEESDGEGE